MSGLTSAFPQWAEPWTRLGLGLSLWDEQAECTGQAHSNDAFWQTLMQHSPRFQLQLRKLVRRALTEDQRTIVDTSSGFTVQVVAITQRTRPIGCVVVCGLAAEFFDEENLARFCDQHQLDRLVMQRLAVDLPRHAEDTLHCFGEIINNHLQSFTAGALANRDVGNLSSHLAQAYEELNLIYRVSTNLTVLRRPAAHFEKLCAELLGATVVESFAAILENGSDQQAAEPTVVKAGPVNASPEQLIRLYQQVRFCQRNAGACVVINNVRNDSAFSWAADWLEQFVFFELSRNENIFGGLLALNHVDREDFGSEEIQLINTVAERSSAFVENVRLYEDLEQLFMGMLHALVSSIDAKDPYTCGHSQRVAWLSQHIAQLSGISESKCQRVYLSGLLHDIGKIGISESVLRKTGRLTEDEFKEMKRHPEIGARILEGMRQVEDVIPGVLHHHERYDGKGYPKGLSGDNIPFLGRVIGLVDSFDAMTTSRTYRTARPIQIAEAEIRRCSGTQFDPGLVDLLLNDDLKVVSRKMSESDKSAGAGIGRYAGLASRFTTGDAT